MLSPLSLPSTMILPMPEEARAITANDKGMKEHLAGRYLAASNYFRKAYNDKLPSQMASSIAYNVASSLMDLGEYNTALDWINRSLKHEDDHMVQYSKSLCLMQLGRFQEGLSLYHHRYLKTTHDAVRFPTLPIDYLEANQLDQVIDKNVLVLNEQGFGDEIMFLRILPWLSKNVKSAYVQIYPELSRLVDRILANKFSNITFFTDRSFDLDFVNKFEVYSSLGTIWAALTKIKTLAPIVFENDAPNMFTNNGTLRIGVIISPNKKSKNANRRAVNEKIFGKIASQNQHIQLYSLQYDTKFSWADNSLVDRIQDFYDTYVFMKSMDLVITCDTGTAHLVNSMEIPSILLYSNYLDWRWKYGDFYPNANVIQAADHKKLVATIKKLTGVDVK